MEQILEKSRTLMKTNAFLHFNNEMFSHPALQWNVSCRKCVQMLYCVSYWVFIQDRKANGLV